MTLVFDHLFFRFLALNPRRSQTVRILFNIIASILKLRIIAFLLYIIERIISFFLTLPIPIFSFLIKIIITNLDGFFGYYVRGLYYSKKLKKFSGNLLIEPNVYLKNPKNYVIDSFVLLDYGCTILCDELYIEEGCHLAVHSLISGGGKVIIKKYSGLGIKSAIISATDTIIGGFRHSGPMIPEEQRSVSRPTTIIEKDVWTTTNVTVLPGITMEEGSVVTPHSVVYRNTKAWQVYGPERIKKYASREPIKFEDPDYSIY